MSRGAAAPARQVTVTEVAHRVGVAPSTIRAYLARGQMPAATGRLGRTPWWSPAAIDPWIASRKS